MMHYQSGNSKSSQNFSSLVSLNSAVRGGGGVGGGGGGGGVGYQQER